jgi:hypothetical protein
MYCKSSFGFYHLEMESKNSFVISRINLFARLPNLIEKFIDFISCLALISLGSLFI